MLRIGKNAKDQEDTDHTTHKPEVPDYATAKPYSYQSTSEVKPATESAPTPARGAMTESETLARDIKEGTLSGFVGGGTDVTGEANFKAMMRVDGHFSGRITSSSGTLIVGVWMLPWTLAARPSSSRCVAMMSPLIFPWITAFATSIFASTLPLAPTMSVPLDEVIRPEK